MFCDLFKITNKGVGLPSTKKIVNGFSFLKTEALKPKSGIQLNNLSCSCLSAFSASALTKPRSKNENYITSILKAWL